MPLLSPRLTRRHPPGPVSPVGCAGTGRREGPGRPTRTGPQGLPPPQSRGLVGGDRSEVGEIRRDPNFGVRRPSSRARALGAGVPGGVRRWELVKTNSSTDAGSPGMAQLSVVPGSATGSTGEWGPRGHGGWRGSGCSGIGRPPHFISSRGRGTPTTGRASRVKRPRWTLGSLSQSHCRHPCLPAVPRQRRGDEMGSGWGEAARGLGGAVQAPPSAHALAAPRDVTLGYKSCGARPSRRWWSSRLRAVGERGATGTLGRGRLSDVLLRAPHRGWPQGDGHEGGGVSAAAAPNEAGGAVHSQGLCRPATLGRSQEAGLFQGHATS